MNSEESILALLEKEEDDVKRVRDIGNRFLDMKGCIIVKDGKLAVYEIFSAQCACFYNAFNKLDDKESLIELEEKVSVYWSSVNFLVNKTNTEYSRSF